MKIESVIVSTGSNGLLTRGADVLSFSPLCVAILHFGKLERVPAPLVLQNAAKSKIMMAFLLTTTKTV